jgi:3',5'-cyclic-AMP phosphodiesterase
MKNVRGVSVVIVVWILLFSGCESPFTYSPYEADVEEQYRNTTQKNLERIRSIPVNETQEFRVALLSDTHYHFDDLSDAIEVINQKKDVSFVIVTGDIAESGLLKEFEFFHNIMSGLNKPYLTVIGNHDYLSNGAHIYQDMFGARNYSFVFKNVKFVMFDNVTMESNRTPDMEWFGQEVINSGGHIHIIPFSHIFLFDKQFAKLREGYYRLLKDNGIALSVNGHKHDYEYDNYFEDEVYFLTIPSPDKRAYVELLISPSGIQVEKIDY